jgi:hypothetical protein
MKLLGIPAKTIAQRLARILTGRLVEPLALVEAEPRPMLDLVRSFYRGRQIGHMRYPFFANRSLEDETQGDGLVMQCASRRKLVRPRALVRLGSAAFAPGFLPVMRKMRYSCAVPPLISDKPGAHPDQELIGHGFTAML